VVSILLRAQRRIDLVTSARTIAAPQHRRQRRDLVGSHRLSVRRADKSSELAFTGRPVRSLLDIRMPHDRQFTLDAAAALLPRSSSNRW
jgi:hypothetical protein